MFRPSSEVRLRLSYPDAKLYDKTELRRQGRFHLWYLRRLFRRGWTLLRGGERFRFHSEANIPSHLLSAYETSVAKACYLRVSTVSFM